jgi:hypothetical protein
MTGVWLPHTTRHPIPALDHGARPRTTGIVIHINVGTFDGTIAWFEKPSDEKPEGTRGVGAHLEVGDGRVWQLAGLDRKCWHAGAANDHTIGFEHAGVPAWTRDDWLRHHHTELALSANRGAWVLHEFGLGRPRRHVNIFRHSDGGAAWGGHDCPGAHFPLDVWEELCLDAYLAHWGRHSLAA